MSRYDAAVTSPAAATLTIVGDVHRHWRRADADYLERSRPDHVLFVGDLGDEDVEMVRIVTELQVPKSVMLGNHDAWQSFSKGRATDALYDSLAQLGDDHLAYAVREVPAAGVSIVGARPFSWGGQSLRSVELYDELYSVRTHRQSAARIVEAARSAQHRDLVILAHNGPLGLSRQPGDIYGKDFGKPGGDWGDRDLALAIERIEALGLRVQMVVAGHMHHRLVQPRGAERVRFCRTAATLFVNPAVVPRIRGDGSGGSESYFVRTRWAQGRCLAVEELWVGDTGAVRTATSAGFVECELQRIEGNSQYVE